MIAGCFAGGMPPGVLEPLAGGSIAVPGREDKETGLKSSFETRSLRTAPLDEGEMTRSADQDEGGG
jgi:hypothetical protein